MLKEKKTSHYRQSVPCIEMELEANCSKMIQPSAVSLSLACVVSRCSYTVCTCLLHFHRQQGRSMGQGKKKKIKGPSTTNTPPMVLECILFFFLFPPLSQQKSSPFFQVSLSLSEENVSNLVFFPFSIGNENQPSTERTTFFFSMVTPNIEAPSCSQHMLGSLQHNGFLSNLYHPPPFWSSQCQSILYVCSVMLPSHRTCPQTRKEHKDIQRRVTIILILRFPTRPKNVFFILFFYFNQLTKIEKHR